MNFNKMVLNDVVVADSDGEFPAIIISGFPDFSGLFLFPPDEPKFNITRKNSV